MKCLCCKNGEMIEKSGTYIAKLDKCYVIIENVPSFECTQCGEVVYSLNTIEHINRIIGSLEKISSKIFIMDYREEAA